MIPKKIHYCWFGGRPLPQNVKNYIDTWKLFFPDFEIKQWDESNFDINARLYTKQAYYAKKFAFVSDVARLQALYNEGGIYFDTDIMVKKRFPDEWWEYDAFFSFEHDVKIQTGIMASSKGNQLILDFLKKYDDIPFFLPTKLDLLTNVNRFTKYMVERGFEMNNKQQVIDNVAVFPQLWLCGKDWKKGRYDDDTTFAVHDYASTWVFRKTLWNRIKYRLTSTMLFIRWKLNLT